MLNIGTEEVKGNDSVRGAFELLKNAPGINFKGYIEASEFLEGNIDVIVADGFAIFNNSLSHSPICLSLSLHKILFSLFDHLLIACTQKSERETITPGYFTQGDTKMLHVLGICDVVVSQDLPQSINAECHDDSPIQEYLGYT